MRDETGSARYLVGLLLVALAVGGCTTPPADPGGCVVVADGGGREEVRAVGCEEAGALRVLQVRTSAEPCHDVPAVTRSHEEFGGAGRKLCLGPPDADPGSAINTAQVGDCVAPEVDGGGGGAYIRVGCADGRAASQVVERVAGLEALTSDCSAVPGATAEYEWRLAGGGLAALSTDAVSLCLGPVGTVPVGTVPVGAGDASAPATAAQAFAEAYAQSRRDGSAHYTAEPGTSWAGLGYFGSTGEVRFDGDTASVHARLSDRENYIREVAVVDGERWIRSIYPLPEGGWDPCSVQEGGPHAEECAYTLYQQDLADPLALLVRAGPAAPVSATDMGLVDGVRARWFEVEVDEDRAAGAETDPGWRARFADTLFAAGPARVWIGPDQRLLRLELPAGAGSEPDQAHVDYAGWGTVGPLTAPGG